MKRYQNNRLASLVARWRQSGGIDSGIDDAKRRYQNREWYEAIPESAGSLVLVSIPVYQSKSSPRSFLPSGAKYARIFLPPGKVS
ncbi:hypothetical protein E2C01_073756 [Portunus trituberculatus]|uniref:Uncharacterized protein n=1 Tax=Portunus trituberculatus TaxID=210409 RepID=A0A5B7I3U7_PORTR|nr:hypothetical protein [Portunus trituberculatus]